MFYEDLLKRCNKIPKQHLYFFKKNKVLFSKNKFKPYLLSSNEKMSCLEQTPDSFDALKIKNMEEKLHILNKFLKNLLRGQKL